MTHRQGSSSDDGGTAMVGAKRSMLGRSVDAAPWTARFGIMVIIVYVTVAAFAPVIAPYGERQIVGAAYLPPGGLFLLGTDPLGRDMASRLIFGARNSVGVAFGTTCLAFLLGGFTGMLAALRGGWLDQILARAVDVLMAIPQLIFALLLLTVFGTSVPILITVIAVLESTRIFRVTRAVAMNIVVMDYMEVARLRGEGWLYLIVRVILPNAAPPLIAEFGLRFCFVFLFISALSFLGLGIQPPSTDWGGMVRDTARLISFGYLSPLLPAAAIGFLVVAVNFVADWFLQRSSGFRE
jgi:peptide/nickel transport system permease protein